MSNHMALHEFIKGCSVDQVFHVFAISTQLNNKQLASYNYHVTIHQLASQYNLVFFPQRDNSDIAANFIINLCSKESDQWTIRMMIIITTYPLLHSATYCIEITLHTIDCMRIIIKVMHEVQVTSYLVVIMLQHIPEYIVNIQLAICG